jgi:UDPglucose 6-dehydrogenase
MNNYKVCVAGLWHLGTVTAACLAKGGHLVTGFDRNIEVVDRLKNGEPPLFEPGLSDLVKQGTAAGRLRFMADPGEALRDAEILWIAYDTPVDDDDNADVAFVMGEVQALLGHLRPGALVLISSQMPVGSTRKLEALRNDVTFAYSPENLRLGKAIDVFTNPDRVVVGTRNDRDRERIAALLAPFTSRIEWMSVESAEMTKHALNSFLAVSVAFINEVASVCERVGADAKEVERGLKSESRIGPRAYVSPGVAFAGGTLARDVVFLSQLGSELGLPMHLLSGIKKSNDAHRQWAMRRLQDLMPSLKAKRIAVWGLTYKPGTDTLRRSSAVELCRWLGDQGAEVTAHDPRVRSLPKDAGLSISLAQSPIDAARGAEALVVSTEWPEYREVEAAQMRSVMAKPLVLDPARFLSATLGSDPGIAYVTIGKGV